MQVNIRNIYKIVTLLTSVYSCSEHCKISEMVKLTLDLRSIHAYNEAALHFFTTI